MRSCFKDGRVPGAPARVPAGTAHAASWLKVELATGGSALLCGSLLAFRPDGSLMGLPTRVLAGGPFADWRLPGLLLAGFVGVGYLAAGAWERQRYPHGRELSMVAGAGLVVFEAVECRWLGFHPLQAVCMAVGAGVVALAVSAGNPLVNVSPSREARPAR